MSKMDISEARFFYFSWVFYPLPSPPPLPPPPPPPPPAIGKDIQLFVFFGLELFWVKEKTSKFWTFL